MQTLFHQAVFSYFAPVLSFHCGFNKAVILYIHSAAINTSHSSDLSPVESAQADYKLC